MHLKPDTLTEALEHDRFAIVVVKVEDNGTELLMGHVPIEISSFLYHFLKKDTSNCIRANVTGKRMREIGLVVPASFEAYTKSIKDAITLDKEMAKRKEMFPR